MTDINQGRQEAGQRIVEAFKEFVQGPPAQHDVGEALVSEYLIIPMQGDPFDNYANVVDIMTDLGHYLFSEGKSFADANLLASRAESGNAYLGKADELLTDAAGIIIALKNFYDTAEHKNPEKNFDDAVWIANFHLEEEIGVSAAPTP